MTACACRCGRSSPSTDLSVYTPVAEAELARFLENFSVGTLVRAEPIKAGIENTNYFVDAAQGALVESELRFQAEQRFPDLPRGPVHGDLFRDNALFEGRRLSGVIDFYFAGVHWLLYDVAVCANDWCLVEPSTDRRLDAQ